MKNEKLVKAAGTLDMFAKVLGGMAHVCGYICLGFAVLVLIFGEKMFDAGSLTLDIGSLKLYLADGIQIEEGMMKLFACVGLAAAGVLLHLVYRAMKLVRGIFAPMKESRPFDGTVPANLKKIAWLSLAAGLVIQIAGFAELVIVRMAYPMDRIFASEAISDFEFVFAMDFNFVFIFCLLMLLSHVFSYGQQLQKESDETL